MGGQDNPLSASRRPAPAGVEKAGLPVSPAMSQEVVRKKMKLAAREGGAEVEIALLDWGGEGPLALLHHANGFCAGMWEPLVETLRERFRVVAMDGRGHGDSSKPEGDEAYAWGRMVEDLVAVSERLLAESGQERIAQGLGHSFGGTLTLAAAAACPDRFERVAMLDPVILPPLLVRAEFPGRSSELAQRARRRRHHWASREEARAYLAERALFASWVPEALDLYVSEGLRESGKGGVELKCPGRVEAAVFDGARGFDIFEAARGLALPVRLFRATRGDFPRSIYEELVELLPGADIEDFDAGHLIPMECPAQAADAVLRFCDAGSEEVAGPKTRKG
jgi:pimeloyl-ACP methyl ester carboxylesterase